ncbi:MAG TPA: FKBP-type peptidyl-prolyl cis-trans isomerase [Thermoplasmata archaeon]|jgi:hypothetical protein
MVRRLRDDDAAMSNWVALLLVVIIVGAILGVYFVYLVSGPPASPITAQLGDTVRVEYIGTFANSGLVFDTNNKSVADDGATYPKAFSFAAHSTWSPLEVVLGQHTVVKGFEDGLFGLRVGESTAIVVIPEEGYGPADPAKVFVHSLLESVPVRTTWNFSAFNKYFNAAPVSGAIVTDPVWRWPVSVSVANAIVTAIASPIPGQAIRPYGAWDAQVLSIDDTANGGAGLVLVQHRLTPAMVDRAGGTDPSGAIFYVSAVDLSAGTYTLNFNSMSPPVGRTLVFQVTVASISRTA